MMEGGFTAREKLRELEREIMYRVDVYARIIKRGGNLTRSEADRRIDIMRAIAADYHVPAIKEQMAEDQAITRRHQELGENRTTILSGG